MDTFAIVFPSLAIPLALALMNIRAGIAAFVLLTPAYMYHKSMFVAVGIGEKAIQWPTLTKDFTAVVLFIILLQHTAKSTKTSFNYIDFKRIFGAFFIFTLLSYMTTIIRDSSILQGIIGLRPYVLFPAFGALIGFVILNKPKHWLTYSIIILIFTSFIAILAIIHLKFQSFLIHSSLKQLWAGILIEWFTYADRLRSYFTSPNVLGWFMGLGIVNAIFITFITKHPQARLFSMIILPFYIWVLMLTKCRSALLGILVALVLLTFHFKKMQRSIYIFFITLFTALFFVIGPYSDRFDNVADNPRLTIWAHYISSTITNPVNTLFGHGLGTSGRAGLESSAAAPDIEGLEEISSDKGVFFIDSTIIKAFYELGLIGLLYLASIIYLYLNSFRLFKNLAKKEAKIMILPQLIMTYILIISFFSAAALTYPWNFFLWMSGISIYAASRQYRNEKSKITP